MPSPLFTLTTVLKANQGSALTNIYKTDQIIFVLTEDNVRPQMDSIFSLLLSARLL